jgi:hypothetical protein
MSPCHPSARLRRPLIGAHPRPRFEERDNPAARFLQHVSDDDIDEMAV